MVNGNLSARPAPGLSTGRSGTQASTGAGRSPAAAAIVDRLETGLPMLASYLAVADFIVGSAALIA
jgi:hypothetical protein